MTCYNVIHEFMEVQKDFMTVPLTLIQKSFCVTGIYPFNPNIFTEEDFAPSQVFSVKAHTLASFPETIPSSDPAIPNDIDYNSEMYSSDADSDFQVDPISPSDAESNADETPTTQSSPPEPSQVTCSISHKLSKALTNQHELLTLHALQHLSHKDLVAHILNLQGSVCALEGQVHDTLALCQSPNGHCTIALHQLRGEKMQLENANKKQVHGSTMVKTHTIISPDLEKLFEEEERQAKEREEAEEEKEQQKAEESGD